MSRKKREMNVYLLLEYDGDKCTVLNIYTSNTAAHKAAYRKRDKEFKKFSNIINPFKTYHVITKSVKGSNRLIDLLAYFHPDIIKELL